MFELVLQRYSYQFLQVYHGNDSALSRSLNLTKRLHDATAVHMDYGAFVLTCYLLLVKIKNKGSVKLVVLFRMGIINSEVEKSAAD